MRIALMVLRAPLAAACNPPTGGRPPKEIDSDDYNKIVFDPELRGTTDRFVMRFKKTV